MEKPLPGLWKPREKNREWSKRRRLFQPGRRQFTQGRIEKAGSRDQLLKGRGKNLENQALKLIGGGGEAF